MLYLRKKVSKLPLYLKSSPIPTTEERYNNYKEKSIFMINY